MLMSTHRPLGDLENPSEFIARHIGISAQDETHMLGVIGEASRRALIESIVPRSIARAQAMQLPGMDVLTVSRLLRHKSVRTLEVHYLATPQKRLRQAANDIGERLLGASRKEVTMAS